MSWGQTLLAGNVINASTCVGKTLQSHNPSRGIDLAAANSGAQHNFPWTPARNTLVQLNNNNNKNN